MMERLRLALLLPLSRKVLVALAAGALAWANQKLGLGLSDDVLKFLIGLAAFVILGIAIEDHGKARAAAESSTGVRDMVEAHTEMQVEQMGDDINKQLAQIRDDVEPTIRKVLNERYKL